VLEVIRGKSFVCLSCYYILFIGFSSQTPLGVGQQMIGELLVSA